MSGTWWNSVGKKHVEQRSRAGSGMTALGIRPSIRFRNVITTSRFLPDLQGGSRQREESVRQSLQQRGQEHERERRCAVGWARRVVSVTRTQISPESHGAGGATRQRHGAPRFGWQGNATCRCPVSLACGQGRGDHLATYLRIAHTLSLSEASKRRPDEQACRGKLHERAQTWSRWACQVLWRRPDEGTAADGKAAHSHQHRRHDSRAPQRRHLRAVSTTSCLGQLWPHPLQLRASCLQASWKNAPLPLGRNWAGNPF